MKPFFVCFPIGNCRVWIQKKACYLFAQAARQAQNVQQDLKAWPQRWDARPQEFGGPFFPCEHLPEIKYCQLENAWKMEVLRELLEFINNWDVSGISHGLMGYNDIRERIFRLNIGYLKIWW
jgi:hypothetical protein